MKKLLLVSLALCLTVGASAQSKQGASNLPVIDIKKEYPKKKLLLKDIATAEYIPLETSDDVLLDAVAKLHFSLTDNYITSYNAQQGQIFVFDKKGKICHTFCNKGGSGEEYNSYLLQVRLDEKAKEIFVMDQSNKIQVYTIDGKYKRTLRIPEDVHIKLFYNCDDKNLLCYDDYLLDREGKQPNSRPYLLMSKKDGAITRLPVTINHRIGNRTYITEDGQRSVITMTVDPIAKSGSEFILADYAGDTVYSYRNHKLTPLFVRTPESASSDPRLLLQCDGKIGRYLLMSTALKKYEPGKNGFETKTFAYDTVEKKVYDLEFEDPDYEPARPRSMRVKCMLPELPEKCVIDSWDADRLLDMLEKGKLAGNLKKAAEKMTIDDNPLIILYKFK